MHFVKRGAVTVQYGHQVDDCIMAGQQCSQRLRVMHISLHHRDQWQHLHRARRQAPRHHGHGDTGAVERFTHMTAYKTAST